MRLNHPTLVPNHRLDHGCPLSSPLTMVQPKLQVRAEVAVVVQMAAETEATAATVVEADAAMVVETMRTDSNNNQQSGSDSGRDRGRVGIGGGSVVANWWRRWQQWQQQGQNVVAPAMVIN